MLGLVPSASLLGIDGHAVTVEVHITGGLPSFTVVGLPDASCREARDRVRAAIQSTGLTWPMQRVTVNLAPPTVRKVGSGLDLAIAMAMLIASGQITQQSIGPSAFLGELGLDGTVRPVIGTVCLTDALGDGPLVLAPESVEEARLVGNRPLHPVRTLGEIVACARGDEPWPSPGAAPAAVASGPAVPDLADVRGQPVARFALEVAAAGAHHLLMLGPPGTARLAYVTDRRTTSGQSGRTGAAAHEGRYLRTHQRVFGAKRVGGAAGGGLRRLRTDPWVGGRRRTRRRRGQRHEAPPQGPPWMESAHGFAGAVRGSGRVAAGSARPEPSAPT